MKQRRPQSNDKICRNCFHICSTVAYNNHHASCVKFEAATIEMPSEDKKQLTFRNFNAPAHASVVVYFDLESIIVPTSTTVNINSATKALEKHEPCGFCFVIIKHGSALPVHVEIDRSRTCMKKLAENFSQSRKRFTNASRAIVSFVALLHIQMIRQQNVGFVVHLFLMKLKFWITVIIQESFWVMRIVDVT